MLGIEGVAESASPTDRSAAPRPFGASLVLGTLAGSQVCASLLNLLRAKGVALLLGPSGVGTVSVVDQLASVAAFTAALALPTAATRYLSRADSEGAGALASLYDLLVRTLLLVATVVALAASLVVIVWPRILGEQLEPHATAVALALLAVPAMGLHGLAISLFAALRRPRLASLARLGATAGLTLGALVGMAAGGLHGLYVGNLAAAALVALTLLAGARRGLGLRSRARLPAWREWRQHRDVLRFCGITYLVTIGEPAAFLLARYALLTSTDLAEVGLFQSAYAVASSLGMLLLQSVAFYLVPLLNRHGPAPDKAEVAFRFARMISVWTAALAVPLLLFPQLVLALLFSDAFTGAAPFLVLFILDQALLLCAAAVQALLVGLDDLGAYLVANVAAQVVLALLCWQLAPTYGPAGLGIAFVVAHGGLLLALLGRVVFTHGRPVPRSSAGAMLYALGLIAGLGWLGQGALETTGRSLVGLAGLASLALLLTGQERHALWLAVGKLWRSGPRPATG